MSNRSKRPPLFSISLLSATLLAYEILLMHLFAIIQYHHFAYMIIGLALLGYGSSGTFLTLFQARLKKRYNSCYIAAIVLFSCSALVCFFLAQSIPFNGQELFWDIQQVVALSKIFLLILLPFFFGALAIGLTLGVYRNSIATVYGADLIGAGMGSLLIIVLLFLFFPQHALLFVCGMGFLSAAIALFELGVERPAYKFLALCSLFVILFSFGFGQQLKMSPYKTLRQYLMLEGAEVSHQLSSPLGLVQVLESPVVPLRHAPGMSLTAGREPVEQKGIFINGEGLSVIAKKAESPEQFSYLDQMTSALPYHLGRIDSAVILGLGGGSEILQAKYHGVESISGVELNPQLVALLQGKYGDFSGRLLSGSVTPFVGDIRGFMEENNNQFDLVQLSLIDSFLPSASGLYGLRENYLYTVEALGEYLDHLTPEGYLSITRWIKIPPRDGPKLLATAVAALKKRGVADVKRHLLLIRGWQTSTLVIKNAEFSLAEVSKMEEFGRARSFDIGYSYTALPEQVNLYNVLRQPLFYQAATALVGANSQQFIKEYKFNLEPATDNKPYFHHFVKWSALGEILKLRTTGGAALLESGYLILLTVLGVAVIFSFLLILGPLLFFRRKSLFQSGPIRKTRIFFYFFLTGIAFLFIEIAYIQKFILFLHHPVYAVSSCVASFLVFGGVGSIISKKWSIHLGQEKLLKAAVLIIATIGCIYLLLLGKFFTLATDFSLPGKIVLSVIMIAPLAFFMGMPFPLALSSLTSHGSEMIPWAWGINGCSSVISSMLATLLAIHFGFSGVIVVATIVYLLLPTCFPAMADSKPQR